jgi:hypothetical protein
VLKASLKVAGWLLAVAVLCDAGLWLFAGPAIQVTGPDPVEVSAIRTGREIGRALSIFLAALLGAGFAALLSGKFQRSENALTFGALAGFLFAVMIGMGSVR